LLIIIRISLIFTLPESDFARVQERLSQGPLTVFVDDQNGRQLDQGKLNLIDNQIIQTTGTIRLRAEFPNHKHLLLPGRALVCGRHIFGWYFPFRVAQLRDAREREAGN
jgi:membrane fusion protein, multidrug efflux system